MARPLRIEYDGAFYHVTARGNERKRVFFAKADYEAFKGYLKEAKEKYRVRLHCYVFMTNHYHLLLETPQAKRPQCLMSSPHPRFPRYFDHCPRVGIEKLEG
jgi:putative transposase